MHDLTENTELVGEQLDETDQDILRTKTRLLDQNPKPRVGDYIRFADGTERRISHLWTELGGWDMEDAAQTSDGGSFYLGDGYATFSGSLFGGTPLDKLSELVGEKKLGDVWFFHHNVRRAYNGVDTSIPFRIYISTEEAPR